MSANPEISDFVYLPYTAKTNKQGNVVMSSHTALETEAVGLAYLEARKRGKAGRILAAGEYTFGPNNPSTSALSRNRWIDMGINEEDIVIGEGFDSTVAQLRWVKRQGAQDPEVYALGFHKIRSRINMWKEGIKGNVVNAEMVISKYHPNKPNARRLRKFVEGSGKPEYKSTTRKSIFPSIYVAETFLVVCTLLGPIGKRIENVVRSRLGADGPTVTDYHYVGPASAYPH